MFHQGRHRRPRRRTLAAAAFLACSPALAVTWGHHQDHHGGNQVAALTANPDCTLRVPREPLTAQGLATPYILRSAGADCAEDQATGAFVQATILNPATGAVSVYDPEVITDGQVAPVPPVPVLPRHAVVGIWVGFNGNVLKLTGPGAHDAVNFAQQAYIGSTGWFEAANHAVAHGKLVIPPIGMGSDGLACPTSRDPSVVDQDPNDNVPVTYAYGAQASNGSDEQLLDLMLGALGCHEWLVPLLDPTVGSSSSTMSAVSPSGMLQELQAAADQAMPLLVPGNDPFTLNDGAYSPYLTSLYRAQVNQPPSFTNHTQAFCQAMGSRGAAKLKADVIADAAQPAPVFAPIGSNLANVLAARFAGSWVNLHCDTLLGVGSPVTVTLAGGIAVSAAYAPLP
jgi:hypothetical protein